MKKRVVVVDDDQQFATLIVSYLNGRGYDAVGLTCYTDAFRRINDRADLVIIDIHLGDGDGLVLLYELQTKYPDQKYVVLTGDDSLPIRLQSFAKGADDYMKKPIFPSELEARIRRLLSTNARSICSVGCIDYWRYTKQEQKVIEMLQKSRGEVVPIAVFEELLNDSESAVYTTISRLRKKLKKEYVIKSSYGRGWYLQTIPKQLTSA